MVMLQVAITRMSAAELEEAGRVLGAAFVSSPLEQAVRGTIDDRQRRGLVRAYTATCRLPGQVSVAWSDDRVVGRSVGWSPLGVNCGGAGSSRWRRPRSRRSAATSRRR